MDAVLRAAGVYIFLLLILRLSGKRTLAQVTTFDFVLLLIIGEATQQGLIGDDFSVTKSALLIVTLVGIDIGFSLLQERFPVLGTVMEGAPLILLKDGEPLHDRMTKARIDEHDIMEAGRTKHGLERFDQIKYAVLERDGGISVIPKAEAAWRESVARDPS
ncbi:MAG: DUF421 domain-containing protein [Actinomycetota bacterium]